MTVKRERLDEALERHRGIGPGFHFLRHALSFIILAHHCRVAVFGVFVGDTYAKGAAMSAYTAAGLTRGQLAVELLRPFLFALVGTFFALSGFLVFGSALRSSVVKTFFLNRVLRIVPALSVETTLSALILGPLVTSFTLHAYFGDWQFWRYLGNIVGHIWFELPGVFLTNPWPRIVNANLWTLPAELWCYLGMLILMATGLVRNRRVCNALIALALLIAVALFIENPIIYAVRWDTTRFMPWYIVMMFFIGAAYFINADKVYLDIRLFVASGAIYYVLMLTNYLGPISGVFLTYCMVYIGMSSFTWFDRLVKVDLSYGTYLYGFPLTQGLIYLLLPHLQWLPGSFARFLLIFPLVLASTVAFAILSWTYIEKPALKLRHHRLLEPWAKATRSAR